MSSTQHQLIEQCATRLRGIVEALDNIHDNTPHRWSTDLDDVHSSAESLLVLIKDQAPTQAAQDLALRTIAEYPCPEQDNMTAANMRQVAADAITGALAFGAQASQPPAEDHWLRPFYDIGRAEGQRTQELAMLVRMLASSLKRHAPESNLVARATNYLAAKGLAGTPLRDPPAPVEQAGRDVEPAPCPFCGGEVDPTGWLRGDGTRGPECNYCGATARSMEAWQTRAALAQPEGAPVIGCLCGMPMTEGHHSPAGCSSLEEFATHSDQAQHSVPRAWLDVQAERRRQVEAEGWTPEHDDEHSHGQMARAAACYALAGSSAPNDGTAALLVSLAWPWDEQWWKPSTARRDLVKACALALAEIERLDRATVTQGGPRDA
ncbi:hypothetical protein ACUHOQ_000241 [Pseudomonas aeruginosa]|uniref:hypothetical protein n=1 Tax=Pseudomonas aeruginosa TaxID=287 RepID=UPI0020A68578|nr:hypothetical protein [Pseudomonas aeruginosa]